MIKFTSWYLLISLSYAKNTVKASKNQFIVERYHNFTVDCDYCSEANETKATTWRYSLFVFSFVYRLNQCVQCVIRAFHQGYFSFIRA